MSYVRTLGLEPERQPGLEVWVATIVAFNMRRMAPRCRGDIVTIVNGRAMDAWRRAGLASLLGFATLGWASAHSSELQIQLDGVDASGTRPLADAVVSLHPAKAAASPAAGSAIIDQRQSMFVPDVLAVQAGTLVSFPNSDNTLHHVYSFSPAKRFERPLYSGKRAEPVLFDVPGVVVLGCNIHDWMVAHVVVLDTPYFAVSDVKGTVRIEAPPGDYELRIWHAQQVEPREQPVHLKAAGLQRDLWIKLRPQAYAPQTGSPRLRELQKRLRQQPDASP